MSENERPPLGGRQVRVGWVSTVLRGPNWQHGTRSRKMKPVPMSIRVEHTHYIEVWRD